MLDIMRDSGASIDKSISFVTLIEVYLPSATRNWLLYKDDLSPRKRSQRTECMVLAPLNSEVTSP